MNCSENICYRLGTEDVKYLIWHYSTPAIIGAVVMALYNIVDRILIGQLVGPLALSGLAITFPFMIMHMAFSMLVGTGAATRISICIGEDEFDRANRLLANALILTFVLSIIVITLSYLFLHKLLLLFGASTQTIFYAESFMRIIIPGQLFSSLNYSFNNIMRASGYPRKAMYTMLICALLNAVLVSIFIFCFGWGIKGAAWATNITYLIGSIWVLQHFISGKSNLVLIKKYLVPDKKAILSILSIGISPFSMQIATCFVMLMINTSLLKFGGELAVGAYGIINSINTLIIMFIIGLNQGAQPIIGFNYGSGQFDRMFAALKLTALIAGLFSVLGFILCFYFSYQVASLFTSDKELIQLSSKALSISFLLYPLVGFQIVFTKFFQSIGKAKISIILSLSRQLLFLIPCLVLLPRFNGILGVWLAIPFSDGLAFIAAFICILVYNKRFKEQIIIT